MTSPYPQKLAEKWAEDARMERVEFLKQERQKHLVVKQVGRNCLCPCGSGKKYKRCCLQKTN